MRHDAESPVANTSLVDDTRGAIFTEYAVILLLVAVACIGVWNLLHDGIEDDARTEYVTFGYPPSD